MSKEQYDKIWLTGASMPLARILTAFPERADSLARQLRDQGYNVEFLSPEKAGMLRADLEIDFEICDQKVVLRRAAELANKLHADIAVSPDALPSSLAGSDIYVSESEIVEVPSQQPDPYVESFLAQGERTGQIRNLEHSEHMVALPPDMLTSQATESVRSQETIQPEPVAHTELMHVDVPLEPIQPRMAEPMRAEEPIRHIDVPVFPDPERHAEGTFGFETHASPISDHINDASAARSSEPVTPANPVTPEPVKPKDEWMQRAAILSSTAFTAGKEKSANLWASVRRFSDDCAEWINVRLAAAQEKRQQRQIEAQKQQEIARARAQELEIARDAAAARLQELLRERGGLTDQQPVPPSASPIPAYRRDSPFSPVSPMASGFGNAMNGSAVNGHAMNGSGTSAGPSRYDRFSAGLARFKDVVVTRKYGQQWEAVLMGVAAACALFVVGVAVNSFRPHPALSNTITQPSSASPAPVAARATSGSQPYNGVTIQAGSPGVTLKPSGPAKPAASQQAASQAANTRPASRESDVTVRHINSKLTSRRADGSIAQDVTIRHFNQQPKPAAHNSGDGVKRFSDLD